MTTYVTKGRIIVTNFDDLPAGMSDGARARVDYAEHGGGIEEFAYLAEPGVWIPADWFDNGAACVCGERMEVTSGGRRKAETKNQRKRWRKRGRK